MTVTKFITLSNFPLYLKNRERNPLLTMTNKFIPIWKQQNLSNSLHSIFHSKQFHQKTHVNIRRSRKKKKIAKGKIYKKKLWKEENFINLKISYNSFLRYIGKMGFSCFVCLFGVYLILKVSPRTTEIEFVFKVLVSSN